MVNDGSAYLIPSLFPVVISLFALSVFQVGIIVGVGYLVSVIVQPIVGHYSEGKSPRNFLALGISIIAISFVSFVFATGFSAILGSVVLLRIGSSFFHPVGVSAISRSYVGSKQDRAMGFQSAFGNLGILIVFLISAPFYLILGWRATFAVFGLFAVLDIIVTLLRFKTPEYASRVDSDVRKSESSGYGHRLLGIPFFFVATMFISGGSFAVVLNFANILLQAQNHLGVFVANIAVAGWIASAVFGAILTGRWANGLQRGRLLSLSFVLSALTIFAFTAFSGNLLLVILALIANGFVLSTTYPLTYSELSEYFGSQQERRGWSFGIIFSAQTVGSSVLGLASGYISQFFGLSAAFATLGLVTLVGGGLALGWSREDSRIVWNEEIRKGRLDRSVPGVLSREIIIARRAELFLE
jgi:MFS family permease